MTTTRDRERLDAVAMKTQRMDNSVAPVTGASREGGAEGRVCPPAQGRGRDGLRRVTGRQAGQAAVDEIGSFLHA